MDKQELITQPRTKRYAYADMFKVVMAYLVIMLHFSGTPLTRIAVPFFFIFSGFISYSDTTEIRVKKAKKQIKSGIKYLIIGIVIYFVFDLLNILLYGGNFQGYISSLLSVNPIIDFLILNRPITSGYHLWFLFAYVVIYAIHYFVVKHNKGGVYKFICVPILVLNLLLAVYLSKTSFHITQLEYYRNAFTFGLPLFGIGYAMAQFKRDISKTATILCLVFAVAFFALQYFENQLYIKAFDISTSEFFVSSVVAAALFVIGLTNIRSKFGFSWLYKVFGTKYAFFVYILHVGVGANFNRLTGISGQLLVFLTFLISTAIFLVFRWFCKLCKYIFAKIKNRRFKSSESQV